MRSAVLASLVLVLLLSGCALRYETLKPTEKRDFYERVIMEARAHRDRGELYEKMGYLHLALTEYEQANFYGDIAPVPDEQVAKLNKTIESQSPQFFQAAQKALETGNTRDALEQLNGLLKLNPDYRQGRQQRNELLTLPDFQQQLLENQSHFDTLIAIKNPSAKEQEQIEKVVTQLLYWQHDHPGAWDYWVSRFEARRAEDQKGLDLLNRGRQALAANRLEEAEEAFRNARQIESTRREATRGLVALQSRKDAIYYLNLSRRENGRGNLEKAEEFASRSVHSDRGYQPAGVYLQQLHQARARAEAGERLKQGREHLNKGHYQMALSEAETILTLDPRNQEAARLQRDTREMIKKATPSLLGQGEQLFEQNQLEEAEQMFRSVLQVDPENTISKTYLRRIESRRKTLQMLRN